MYPVLNCGEYSIFGLEPEKCEHAARLIARAVEENRPCPESLSGLLAAPITGTFIYAHPPDYAGLSCLRFSREDWRRHFRRLRSWGIDTAIFQAAAWRELRECYYHATRFPGFKIWNVIEPMLLAASEERMDVFLGGLGFVGLLPGQPFDPAVLDEVSALQGQVFRDLACYRDLVRGVYLSGEAGLKTEPHPVHSRLAREFFRRTADGARRAFPGATLLVSPGAGWRPGIEERFHAYFADLFEGCGVGVLAPQDSIGTGANRLKYLLDSHAGWKRVAEALGSRLWINVELFHRTGVGRTDQVVPADPDRVKFQLDCAARFAEKLVCWEMNFMFSPLAGIRGDTLRRTYLGWIGVRGNAEGDLP